MKLEDKVNQYTGDGALHSSFQPGLDGNFSPFTKMKLHDFINQASNQQNSSPSIQDAAQAA